MARFARPLQYAGIVVVGLRPRQDPRRPPRVRLHGLDSLRVVVRLHRAARDVVVLGRSPRAASAAGGASWVAGLSACGAAASASRSPSSSRTACCCRGSSSSVQRVILVPWFVFCATLARHARTRAEDRERLVFVGRLDEGQLLRDELAAGPSVPLSSRRCSPVPRLARPASGPPLIAAAAEARTPRWSCSIARRRPTSTSSRRPRSSTSGARGCARSRSSTSSGSARSRSGSSSVSRSCSTSARCIATATAG